MTGAEKIAKMFSRGHQGYVNAFRSLSQFLLDSGVSIVFSPEPNSYGFIGLFRHYDGEDMEIIIYRPKPDQAYGTMEDELITLAHEAGHYLSLLAYPEGTLRYEALRVLSNHRADQKPLDEMPSNVKCEFVLEERDAWYYGEKLLREHYLNADSSFWRYFDDHRNKAMETVRNSVK